MMIDVIVRSETFSLIYHKMGKDVLYHYQYNNSKLPDVQQTSTQQDASPI